MTPADQNLAVKQAIAILEGEHKGDWGLHERTSWALQQAWDEVTQQRDLLLTEAYAVYADACESAGLDTDSMEVWLPKYMRVITPKIKAKGCAA